MSDLFDQLSAVNSFLVADFGSVNTRVVLIDQVDGAYRLVARGVARTTAGEPLRDVAVGFYRALARIAEQTGRQLLEASGNRVLMPERQNGNGVDAVLATASVGRPLRVVLVGLMPDVSLTSGLRALAGSYVDVVDTLSLADIRTEERQINDILTHKPDLIFIVGGTDAGAEAPILGLVEVVRQAVQMVPHSARPMVLYAGNLALQGRVRERLEEVTTLYIADNVRPSLLDEQPGPAQQELAAVFDRFKVLSRGGFEEISELSRLGVLPTAQSFTNVVRYLGEVAAPRDNLGVLAVDVGSATTTVAASIRRKPHITIRKDIGLGHSADGILEATTRDNIRRWLTWDASDAEIADYACNKTLRPATVPITDRELELELALAREAIRVAVEAARPSWRLGRGESLPPLRPIIGSGAALANAPHHGLAALVLLDALQPVGVTELWLDPAGLIPALGTLAYFQPAAVVQMLDAGDLTRVGSVVCAEGRPRIGRGGIKVKITLPDGHVERRLVRGGALWTYPLPPGQSAQVELRLSRGLTVNGRSRLKLTLEGGTAGLIFDVRGRPLPLPRRAEVRAQLYPRWVAGTQGRVRLRIDETDEAEVDAAALARAEREAAAAGEGTPTGGRRWRLFRRRPREEQTAPAETGPALEETLAGAEEAESPPQEAPAPSRPRRWFWRRARAQEQEEAAPAAGDEQDEMAGMIDELRQAAEQPRRRRFFRR